LDRPDDPRDDQVATLATAALARHGVTEPPPLVASEPAGCRRAPTEGDLRHRRPRPAGAILVPCPKEDGTEGSPCCSTRSLPPPWSSSAKPTCAARPTAGAWRTAAGMTIGHGGLPAAAGGGRPPGQPQRKPEQALVTGPRLLGWRRSHLLSTTAETDPLPSVGGQFSRVADTCALQRTGSSHAILISYPALTAMPTCGFPAWLDSRNDEVMCCRHRARASHQGPL
jgi:hypothetical protein